MKRRQTPTSMYHQKTKRTLKIPSDSTTIGKLDYPITSTELDKAKIFLNVEKHNLNNELTPSHPFIETHIVPHSAVSVLQCGISVP